MDSISTPTSTIPVGLDRAGSTTFGISVVIPCLDEEQSIAAVVDRAASGIARSGRHGEVIVVDNGSTDRSAEIARAHGARVVEQPVRGYGNAYLAGLAEASGEVIVIGDADETYDFGMIPEFVEGIDRGADLVMGTRLKGKIARDAMPWSHRWIGNPLITGMMNHMLGAHVSDAYCGMRALRRDALPVLDLRSPGMEFALEMVWKSAQRDLVIAEIPIEYHPRRGESKLNSVSDGWRSVKFILQHSPSYLFFLPALVVGLPGLVGALALSTGPVEAFGRTWQVNALLVCVALVLIGAQIAQFGVIARTFGAVQLGDPDPLLDRLYRRVRLEHVLAVGGAMCVVGLLTLGIVFALWVGNSFGALGHEHPAVLGLALSGLGLQTIFAAFVVSIVGSPVSASPWLPAGVTLEGAVRERQPVPTP